MKSFYEITTNENGTEHIIARPGVYTEACAQARLESAHRGEQLVTLSWHDGRGYSEIIDEYRFGEPSNF